ncbi:hypothetical protein ACJIZ3_022166 [Penstemon smallii]|uniref:Uncharacterized protein n=1 Tax=Penstemon smallii TaxID=265156 RepID=A0ABD3SNQ4_9LAMI
MPRTMHMRSEANKINDGWSFDENMGFINLLLQEAKSGNCKDVATLTGACQRISVAMNSQFNRRFSMFSEQNFQQVLHTPGVWYDTQNCEAHVNAFYWRFMESPLFREFRLNGEPYHLKLAAIFDDHDVATFPNDLTGSLEWPIHIRDSDDDEMAVVPYAETGCSVPTLPIAFTSGSSLHDVD